MHPVLPSETADPASPGRAVTGHDPAHGYHRRREGRSETPRGGCTIPGLLRAPFADPATPIFSPGEIVPTPKENIVLMPYFLKTGVLHQKKPCNLAGLYEALFFRHNSVLRNEGKSTVTVPEETAVSFDGEGLSVTFSVP
jgi:hypothetical protein